MNKKLFIITSLIFILFVAPPLIFSIYQGQSKDIFIIVIILIAVLAVTAYEFMVHKKSK